ncbi:MAG TPA: hypothetical protein DCX53_08555 [Anaerolineae bacterium]|nr:hypothetical protein [Anaerolineae bacterium]
MGALHESMLEYKKQLKKGAIQQAYKGLIEYIMGLRTYFQKKYPEYFVSGSIYYGYMDMTYFALVPSSLKKHRLKIAVVFNYETFRFEVWLSGANRQVLEKYWTLIKESGWNKYRLVPQEEKWVDSILEHVLVEDPDFSEPDSLTTQIEKATLKFTRDVENFLSRQ